MKPWHSVERAREGISCYGRGTPSYSQMVRAVVFFNLLMPWDSHAPASLGIPIDRVFSAFSIKAATVALQVSE